MNARSMSTFSRALPSSVWREGRLGEEDVGKGEEGGGEGEEGGGGGGGRRGRGEQREREKRERGEERGRSERTNQGHLKVGVVLYTVLITRVPQPQHQPDRGVVVTILRAGTDVDPQRTEHSGEEAEYRPTD